MSELSKTSIFVALALGAIALAALTRPSVSDFNIDEMRGQPLFDDTAFEGDKVKRLRITSVSEESGEPRVFEVTETNGIWTIPSKSGYPADATQQMGEAIEGLSGKEILTVENTDSGSHAEFGVVDPTDRSAGSGYGTRVQLFDEKDKVLADLIIGKADADGNRYVRREGKDQVFLVNVDVESFSTDFRDWIEKDLLQFSPFDVAEVAIDDYTFAVVETPQGPRPSIDPRAKLALKFDEKSNEWSPKVMEQFDRELGEYKSFELAADQQLNETTLRELKNALDDLVIVDVERKPQGLSADLQAGKEFMNDREAIGSLYERGFYPVQMEDGARLLSSEGEIVVTLKTGIEYVLRFGDLKLDLLGDGAQASSVGEEGEQQAEGVNRYLFVMARFNEDVLEKPELEPLPELPAEQAEAQPAAAEDPAEATTPAKQEGTGEGEVAANDQADAPDSGEEATEQADDDPATQVRKEIEQQREIVQQANEQREKEYQTKVDEGRKRVEELNARFGDWYYVIPNDVFKKIHLGRDEIITTKSADDGDDQAATGGAVPGAGLPDFGLGTDPPAEEPATEPAEELNEAATMPEQEGSESPAESPEAETPPAEQNAEPAADEPTDAPSAAADEPVADPAAEPAANEPSEPEPQG